MKAVRDANGREMTIEEVDLLIERRLDEGWEHGLCGNRGFMTHPPMNDPRSTWCAEWIQYKPNHYVPHWIGRELSE